MEKHWQAPQLLKAAFQGLCPRCGAREVFAGPVSFRSSCKSCSLEFQHFNVGDGPAAFIILIVGGLVTFLAILLELKASPPFWVHISLWLPLTLVLVVTLLRVAKAALLSLEFRNQAREGRLDP